MLARVIRWGNRLLRPARFGDLDVITPASRKFGLDRGQPVDRYYIEAFLQAHCSFITGDVLEVAESLYTDRFGSSVKSALRIGVGSPDMEVMGDLTQPEGLPESICDCFIATQTFNFIYDIGSAFSGAYKLVRPGGVLLGTVSGISQISRYDMDRWGDFWRFTPRSLQQILKDNFSGETGITGYGNVAACIGGLQGLSVEDFKDRSVLDQHDEDYPMIIGFYAKKPANE